MLQQVYDKIAKENVNGEIIEYGLVYGNEKIVFIKTGVDGSIRGYQDKYLQMAYRVHERLGATVICASNPDAAYEPQVVADKAMISEVAAEHGFADYEVYFVGTSDGGYQNLLLAKAVPQTVKLIGINPSLIDMDDFAEKLREIPGINKLLVYGTEDDYYECVPVLKDLDCENLEIITVEGADHEFTGMVEAFIALIDLL